MKVRILALMCCISIVGCGNGKQDGVPDASEETAAPASRAAPVEAPAKPAAGPAGSFTARIGNSAYAIPVTCSNAGTDHFTFLSDESDTVDTNGDGLIVSGRQNGALFALKVVDKGVTWSNDSIRGYGNSPSGGRALSTLRRDGSREEVKLEFSVRCR